MADRETFKKSVAEIVTANKEEANELIARLKNMTPTEFLRLPAKEVERLTARQYDEVVASIVPDLKLTRPAPAQTMQDAVEKHPVSVMARSLCAMTVAIAVSLSGVFAGLPLWQVLHPGSTLVRSTNPDTWPLCFRLAHDTDGCQYRPTQDLSWDYVAASLGVDKNVLLASNSDLPPSYAPSGKPIVIWRGIGMLVN